MPDNVIIAALGVLGLALILWAITDNALERCQAHNTYETCIHSIR